MKNVRQSIAALSQAATDVFAWDYEDSWPQNVWRIAFRLFVLVFGVVLMGPGKILGIKNDAKAFLVGSAMLPIMFAFIAGYVGILWLLLSFGLVVAVLLVGEGFGLLLEKHEMKLARAFEKSLHEDGGK
jgi:fatty acid desaturase